MKTTYTNEQLQEAIDVAFHESSGSHLTTMKYSEEGNWNGESRARLDIARAFLDNLSEPHGCLWEDSEKPDFTAPIACYRIKPEPEIFEAHGKTWTRHTPGDPMPCDGERKVYILTSKTGESKGPRKAFTCAWTAKAGEWWREIIGWRYADEPLVTPPEWAPQAGDVVRLKSGGPLMTVRCFTPESAAICDWFKNDGERDTVTLPITCLKPSTKEDAR
jgi:uncharacterized protein YodC (DUF2158 family)